MLNSNFYIPQKKNLSNHPPFSWSNLKPISFMSPEVSLSIIFPQSKWGEGERGMWGGADILTSAEEKNLANNSKETQNCTAVVVSFQREGRSITFFSEAS